MKYFLFIIIFFSVESVLAQEASLSSYNSYFTGELKLWASSFDNFRLSTFRLKKTASFEKNDQKDLKEAKAFLRMYKPILTFSRDSSQFIDIYTQQMNLTKEGNHYVVNADDGGGVYLCNFTRHYWVQVYYNSISTWIDEVIWLSPTRFMLVGISKGEKNERLPIILIGDSSSELLYEYESPDTSCKQKGDFVYRSPKLKRMDIRE